MPEVTQHAPGTPSYIDLSTTDPEAAQAFYAELFGWEYDEEPTDTGTTYITARLGGKTAAGMMEQPADMREMGMSPCWNSYVTVDDAEAAVKRAEEAGGSVMQPAFDVMDAGRMAVLADPTGGVVCVWEPKDGIGGEIFGVHGTLCWNELTTPDTGAASAFYQEVFGWQAEDLPMEDTPYTMYLLEGQPIGGAMNPPMDGIPPHWGIYINVDDTDAVVEKARSLGAQVMAEPMDTPPGRMAALVDPQGAAFSVIEADADFDPMA